MGGYLSFAALMFALLFLLWAATETWARYRAERTRKAGAVFAGVVLCAIAVLAAVAVVPPAD